MRCCDIPLTAAMAASVRAVWSCAVVSPLTRIIVFAVLAYIRLNAAFIVVGGWSALCVISEGFICV